MRSSPSSPSRSPPSRPLVATLQAHPSNRYTPRCATLISARDLLSPPASPLSQSVTSSRSQASWHYLGSITNECPTVVFHTRLVWSARDAIPTRVQLGVELQPKAQMAQRPPEKVSAEVIEVGRRIGLDLYEYISSFATSVSVPGSSTPQIQMPTSVLDRWLSRFTDRCRRQGLDWLNAGS